jgi:hypothetical protein
MSAALRDLIAAAAEDHMFAPHELPLGAELHGKYVALADRILAVIEATDRDACAAIADKIAGEIPVAPEGRHDDWCHGWQGGAMEVAAAIREQFPTPRQPTDG